MRKFDPNNPFQEKQPQGSYPPYWETYDAPGRLDRVKMFSEHQLEQALALPDRYLQKAVRVAAERRLKKLREERRKNELYARAVGGGE